MRVVTWVDKNGYKHRSLLRDQDPDRLAESGIPLDPPNLHRLDWDELVRELHNLLVDREISDWDSVQRNQNAITSSIITVFKRPIVGLFRTEEK